MKKDSLFTSISWAFSDLQLKSLVRYGQQNQGRSSRLCCQWDSKWM